MNNSMFSAFPGSPSMTGGNCAMQPNLYAAQPAARQGVVTPNRPSILGRYVTSLDEISPRDISADGSVSFFPLNDMSVIYAKQWAPDGSIYTVAYVPMMAQPPVADAAPTPSELAAEPVDKFKDFQNKLDTMQKTIDDFIKSQQKVSKRTANGGAE